MNTFNIVIVTRHASFITVLSEDYGIVGEVLSHASPDAIKGKDVIGNLPLSMCAMANSVTSPTLIIPAEMRGKELSVNQMREYLKGMETFKVVGSKNWNELANDYCRAANGSVADVIPDNPKKINPCQCGSNQDRTTCSETSEFCG